MFHSKPSSADAVEPARASLSALDESVQSTVVVQRHRLAVDRASTTPKRARKDLRSTEPREEQLVEQILQAFNTWSFKREQPDDATLLRNAISRAVSRKEPVPFVLYWGKGPRNCIGTPETTCLDYLESFADRIRSVYGQGAALRLIYTDTHATLNGHNPNAIDAYFASLRAEAQARGFSDCRLAKLVQELRESNAVEGIDARDPDTATLQRLADCAAKWYRGEGSASKGAIDYYRLNMIEKRAVEMAFPHSIFITFNGSEFRSLFPDLMPIFFMYSLKRGIAVKPWFLPDQPK